MSDEKTTNLSSITGANLADNDLVMVVDVSDTTMAATGTNKKVTLNEFAQDSTFSSRYVSKTDDEYVFISASSMAAVASSPTLSWVNGPEGRAVNPAWLMDASSVEFIAGAGVVPQHWSTFHVDLWWTNNASSSGDVVFQLMGVQYADGEQTDNDEINTGQITIAAPTTAGVAKVSRLTSVAITVSTDTVASFGLSRQATAGADTLANDAAVFGLMLVRAS